VKLSIVLAGDCVSDLFAGLQRLVTVVDGLEAAGVTVEIIVVAYSREPDVEALEAAVEGATFVRPAMQDGTILEHWANRDDLGMAMQLGWLPPTPVYIARMTAAKRRARRAAS